MKLYPDLSDDVLDEFLETNSGEFLDLYNNYMYREVNYPPTKVSGLVTPR